MEMGTGDDLVNRPQSLAGVKLSGCKNATPARADARAARGDGCRSGASRWQTAARGAARTSNAWACARSTCERADGPGENCYRVRVDRVSDSRFERTALLGFLDRVRGDGARCERSTRTR